jgi:FxsC-like protein
VSGTDEIRTGPGQRGSYFFLSYAHSPPLTSSLPVDPDQWVGKFFQDLTESVARRASARSGLAPGFFDQDMPLSSDWKASLTGALGTAEVFVPLYSPGYFARSWPGREWSCFDRRLARMGIPNPEQRFAPVLWIPLPRGQNPPGLREALSLGDSDRAYAENGLRTLLRLKPYRASYRLIVDRLATEIVDLAETSPLGPSAAPDIGGVPSAFNAAESAVVFAIVVAAPALHDLSADRDPIGYGGRGIDWRAYPQDQELPLAQYAEQVAEQLDFAVAVEDMEKAGVENASETPASRPGVILIDPWFIADDGGTDALRSFVSDLPRWVLPLLILDSSSDARSVEFAERARALLNDAVVTNTEAARRAINGVGSLKEFISIMPILVADAERQYLRHGPGLRTSPGPVFWPRLAGQASPPQPSEEKNA